MKNIFLFYISLLHLVSCNCSDLEAMDLDRTISGVTWQKQLEYAKNKDWAKTRSLIHGREKNNCDKVSLLEYTLIGTIKSKEEIPVLVNELFSKENFVVQYINKDEFEIVSIQTITQNSNLLNTDNPFSELMSQLEKRIQVGMEIIKLKWEYKGNIFYSTAIAANDQGGIIYDNIGYFLMTNLISESQVVERDDVDVAPRLRSSSEQGNGIITKKFYKTDSKYNYYNIRITYFDMSCISFFDSNNDGILVNRKLEANYDSAFGFSCEADIRTKWGDLNRSRAHEFAWGYVYGSSFSVSLKWEGAGFSTSSGATGAVGSEVHSLREY